jgi:hypothetical protein
VKTSPSWRAGAIAALLVVLSFATRAPALLNAAGTNSDAAIVGLQARHVLHGEWSPLLWGSTYQTSADSSWAALFFAALGPTPLALMLSALVAYVALTLFAFLLLLRRSSSPWRAFVATLPLVFTTACVHSYALYPPRQLSLTIAFAALLVIDRADGAKRPAAWLFGGGLLVMLAWLADPYAVVFLPPATLLAALVVLRARPTFASRAGAGGAFALASLVGAVPLVALWLSPRSRQGVVTMSPSVLGHNARLLWTECLPWAIGTKVYKPLHVMDYVEWHMPVAYAVVAHAGVVFLVAAVVASLLFVLRRSVERPLRHLFVFGAATASLVVVSFLFSLMVMDHFSMRYLAAAVLVLPFVVAPLVERLGASRGALVLAPYLLVAGVGGWFSHGDWTRRGLPVRTAAGRAEDATRLLPELERRHVGAVVADYWAAYRLDLLWREALPVAPLHESQDRHRPYRDALDHARRFAYVFDRGRSFEDEAKTAADFDSKLSRAERFDVGSFAVYVYDRP